MVLVLDKYWESFKRYIEDHPKAEIVYRIESIGADRVRLRIMAGKFGFDYLMPEKDPMLKSIVSFIEGKGATRISAQRSNDTFFA